MLQCSMNLAWQAFEYLEAAFQSARFAVRKLGDATFERGVGDWRAMQPLAARVGEPQRQAPAVGRIRLPVDEAGADQNVDCSADCGRAALHSGGDLVERRRLDSFDCGEEGALLALRLGRGHVGAKLLDDTGEPRR